MLNGLFVRFSILLTLSVMITGQIVTNLWSTESVGRLKSLNFLSEKELLMTSEEGVLSKLDSEGNFVWKKNFMYKSDLDLATVEQYSLIVNKQNGQLDLINNLNSQLIWSVKFQTSDLENSLLKWDLINQKNNFVGLLVTSTEVKLFNKERVVFETKAKHDEMFLDYALSSDYEQLYVISSVEGKKINLYEISLAKTASKVFNLKLTYSLPEKFLDKKLSTFLTRSSFCILDSSGDYLLMDHTKSGSASVEGNLPFVLFNYTVEKFSFGNKILFINFELSEVQILSLETNSFSTLSIQKEKKETILYDKIDTPKKSLIYFLKRKNLNTFIVYDANLLAKENESKVEQFSKFIINEEMTMRKILINPFNNNKMLLTTNENKIITLEKGIAEYKKIDLPLGGIVYAELVGYYNDQGQAAQKAENYKSLSQLVNQKDVSNILTNLLNTIVEDAKDITNKVKSTIQSLLHQTSYQNSEILSKSKHYLILFTESEELIILNAVNKSPILRQSHKNKAVQKIVREDINKNEKKYIYIILKDKMNDNLLSLKFNLDSAELSEDSSLANELLFEEEIRNQCEMLIKNPSNSPLTLTGKLHTKILEKYDNKYSVEIRENKIVGVKYKTSGGKLNLNIAWNLHMRHNSTAFESRFPEVHQHLVTTYHVLGKVFYKYIDSNILLLLSRIEHKTLLVSLISTSSGKILHQSLIDNVDFSQDINSVFEENLVLINYVKKEKSMIRSELFTIEMMKREIEHSFVSLLEKIFQVSWGGDSLSDNLNNIENLKENDLVFLTQTYVLTRKLKGIFSSKSTLNVANKYFLFLMENNQIFLVDKRAVSPRRPAVKEDKGKSVPPVLDPLNSPYVDPELTPYNPIVNFDFKFLMNINYSNDQIDRVLVSPTRYESIFFVCTEGLNLACYSLYPDKTFDTLNESFSYSLIGAFLCGILVLTYMLRVYVKRLEFKSSFLSS